jgi:NADH-quinone oxidoreductase subunit N
MVEKLAQLWPEIALFAATCVVMMIGLSRERSVRILCAPISALGLVAAGVLALGSTATYDTPLPFMATYGKALVAGVGLLLLLLLAGSADRELEAGVDRGRPFEPLRSVRAEFYSFFLFSITGLMLCAGSDDLIFLFLALELTSLPTYVMVATSTGRNRSMEAAVKYFFLGAMGAAVFLYGFALIYGGTGHTQFSGIQSAIAEQTAADGSMNVLTTAGMVLAVLGICFKIAAVPMHFYTPDVYQGSSSSMAGFLAFVPKAAGFFALLSLMGCVGWSAGGLPQPLSTVLFVVAALTMTVGNVLAILQTSVKRILAYSSIAHTGYMLVGVVAGPGEPGAGLARNGLAAVLFYLLCYGVMTVGSFAVLACLERKTPSGDHEEVDSIHDLRGLWYTRPVLAVVMVISAFGLLGLPPLLGFFGKLPLFTAGISAGHTTLVLILAANSAIAAFYYLRLVAVPFLENPDKHPVGAPVQLSPFRSRLIAGVLAAFAVVALSVLGFVGSTIGEAAARAGTFEAAGPAPAPAAIPPSAVVPTSSAPAAIVPAVPAVGSR